MGMGHRALRTSDGRVVAVLAGDTLEKRVVEKSHMLRTPPAWCIDTFVVDEAVKGGARRIEIIATDTGKKYSINMDIFLEKSKPLNRRHNQQLMLPLTYWNTGDERQMSF